MQISPWYRQNLGGNKPVANCEVYNKYKLAHQHCVGEIKRRTHQLVRPNTKLLWQAPYCPEIPPRHQGLTPQRYHRLVRLADSRCRKRPCSGRTYRCWCGRSCCWPRCRRCRLLGCCFLLGRWLLLSCRLFSRGFLSCRLFSRYLLFGGRLLFSRYLLFGGRLLFGRYLLFGGRLLFGRYLLFGGRLLLGRYLLFGGRLFSCCLLCCWFSLLLCYHFDSPYNG
jgi:hypothetical protein